MKRPGQVRNIAFVAVAAACLLTVVVYKAAIYLTPLEDEESSTLEGRVYQNLPELTWESFESGEYQDDFEQFVADSVPGRDEVLLANAALQRSAIRLANLPFGFDAYPTFFGSDYVCIPSLGAVWAKSKTVEDVKQDDMDEWAEACSKVIETAPDVEWAFYLCDRSSVSEANPAALLSSDIADYSYLAEGFLTQLAGDCTVIDGSYTNTDDFAEDHYLTDHHWTIQGAMKTYQAIIEVFDKEALEFGEVYVAYEGPFWGSSSRSGLALPGGGDTVCDVEYDRSSLKVTVDGVERDESFLDESYADDYDGHFNSSLFENTYATYFHSDYGLIEIENLDVQNGESLLIIGDSYTNCMERFFAESYRYVYVIDPRHYEEGTIQEFLAGHDIDDAAFVITVETLDDVQNLL